MARIVTGIKPTGIPHLGNHLGMIRPALELAEQHDGYYFVADYHALNAAPDPDVLEQRVVTIAATLLALGLDPTRTALYRQSDVPEILELSAVLAAVTPKGLLNRAHAYKAAVDANERAGRPADHGVNMGLFSYPLLMAADILALGADVVPTGRDQRQHLDITRDLAAAFNARVGPVLVVPEAQVASRGHTVPGTDGRKMGKSRHNTIPLLAPPDELRRVVMGIVTDSRPIEAVKDPAADTTFQLFELVAGPDDVEALRTRYLAGGLGYGQAKQQLLDVLVETFADARRRLSEIIGAPDEVARIMGEGADRAREHAQSTLERARDAVGIRPLVAR